MAPDQVERLRRWAAVAGVAYVAGRVGSILVVTLQPHSKEPPWLASGLIPAVHLLPAAAVLFALERTACASGDKLVRSRDIAASWACVLMLGLCVAGGAAPGWAAVTIYRWWPAVALLWWLALAPVLMFAVSRRALRGLPAGLLAWLCVESDTLLSHALSEVLQRAFGQRLSLAHAWTGSLCGLCLDLAAGAAIGAILAWYSRSTRPKLSTGTE